MRGRRLFLKKIMTGPTLFMTKKNDGGDTFFLAEITFTVSLLLVLSWLDTERVICLDIVQFTTTHRCAL